MLELHSRLNDIYETLPAMARRDNMRELISTMLSHRTNHKTEERAYFSMLEEFGNWEGVHKADLQQLADSIRGVMYPEQKAANIQAVLEEIKTKSGDYSIDFLRELDTQKAMDWLLALPGVGLKTASLLLLFNFQKPVLPVDTHVLRVTERMGIIPLKTTANKAHSLLLSYIPHDAWTLLNFHKHVYWHGQKVCTYYNPRHELCPLSDICKYFQALDNDDKENNKKSSAAKADPVAEHKKTRGLH